MNGKSAFFFVGGYGYAAAGFTGKQAGDFGDADKVGLVYGHGCFGRFWHQLAIIWEVSVNQATDYLGTIDSESDLSVVKQDINLV